MRKLLFLAAAVPLVFAPSAVAAGDGDGSDSKGGSGSVCRPPDINLDYDLKTFTVAVSLPASGCKAREHTMFDPSVAISPVDGEGADRDLVQRTVSCGPFRPAGDFEDRLAPQYSCNLTVFLSHPESEDAEYAVDVSYPGPAAQRTVSLYGSCVSAGDTAACEE